MEAAALIFFGVSGIVVLVAVGSLLRGWVLSIMWAWFMVPLGAPVLSIPYAIGVAAIVSFLTHQAYPEPTEKTELSTRVGRFVAHLLTPFIVLGFAWVVKQFI